MGNGVVGLNGVLVQKVVMLVRKSEVEIVAIRLQNMVGMNVKDQAKYHENAQNRNVLVNIFKVCHSRFTNHLLFIKTQVN